MRRNCPGNYGGERGWIHHKWIYNYQGGLVVAYPKLSFIEVDSSFDKIADLYTEDVADLQIFWGEAPDIKFEYYNKIYKEGFGSYYNGLFED